MSQHKSPITTHVLDTALGRPAPGVPVCLELQDGKDSWKVIATGITNNDGRVANLLTPGDANWGQGVYRITFDTEQYLKTTGQSQEPFFPSVPIIFRVTEPETHYHVPLLLSPFGFSTYRGS